MQHNHSARQGFSQFLATYESAQDCAYDLFHITRTQEESIKALEVKAGIRKDKKNENVDSKKADFAKNAK